MLSMILITKIRCRAPAYVGHLDRGEEELQALNLERVRNLSTYVPVYYGHLQTPYAPYGAKWS